MDTQPPYQPKGFAFVEFDSHRILERALNLHHTVFLGRKINVELTAGGGGKGSQRQTKIEEKNLKLNMERCENIEAGKKKPKYAPEASR